MPEIFSGKTTKNPRPLVVVVGSLSTPVDGDCLAGIIEIFFMESLILAQDERWLRA